MQGLTRTKLEAILDVGLIGCRALASKNFRPPIALVGKQRMTDMLHVSPDLVCATCLQTTFHQRGIAVTLEHPIVSDSGFTDIPSCWEYCHTLPVTRITPDIALNTSSILREVAPYQRNIAAMRVVIKELRAQLRLGIRGFGNDKQSTGIFVNTVNQSYAGVVRVVAGQIAEVPGNGVNQCPMKIAHPWVNYQPCRFVDDHQLVVFVDHIKGNILRLDGRIVVRTVEHQSNDIACTHLIVTLDRFAIDMDKTGISRFLNAVTGRMLHMLRHVFVDTRRLLTAIHLHAQMLVELTIALFVKAQRDVVQFFDLKVEVWHAIVDQKILCLIAYVCHHDLFSFNGFGYLLKIVG